MEFPPPWTVEEHAEFYLRQVPALNELVDQYGVQAVYSAGTEALGHPPTWNPSVNDCLKIRAYLQEHGYA